MADPWESNAATSLSIAMLNKGQKLSANSVTQTKAQKEANLKDGTY